MQAAILSWRTIRTGQLDGGQKVGGSPAKSRHKIGRTRWRRGREAQIHPASSHVVQNAPRSVARRCLGSASLKHGAVSEEVGKGTGKRRPLKRLVRDGSMPTCEVRPNGTVKLQQTTMGPKNGTIVSFFFFQMLDLEGHKHCPGAAQDASRASAGSGTFVPRFGTTIETS